LKDFNHGEHRGTPGRIGPADFESYTVLAIGPAPVLHINDLTHAIIKAAMRVHSVLGPGLLENAYEACLVHELRKAGFKTAAQVVLPVVYDGVNIDLGYRLDVVVEGRVIVELRCVEALTPIYEAQLLSYLRLSGIGVGLLINFHVKHLRDGIKHTVSGSKWERA
jgi:GxxExxY protein